MKNFETLESVELSKVLGGKSGHHKSGWHKAWVCGSSLVSDGASGFFKGSVFGTAASLSYDLVTKCGVGPQPRKVY